MSKDKNGEKKGFWSKMPIWYKKTKSFLRKLARICLNPHMLICFGIAWLITNGWCYIFIAVGSRLDINWMWMVGTAYAAFLWVPFTPEKLITIIISLFLLKIIFPKDEKTLKVLRHELDLLKDKFRKKKAEYKERKKQKDENRHK